MTPRIVRVFDWDWTVTLPRSVRIPVTPEKRSLRAAIALTSVSVMTSSAARETPEVTVPR